MSDTSPYRHNPSVTAPTGAYRRGMQTFWYEQGSSVLVFNEPQSEPEPGRFLGTLDMGVGELELLRVIVDDYRVDSHS